MQQSPAGQTPRFWRRRLARLAWVYLFWFGATALNFGHTSSTFLRAESGYYQFQCRQSPELQWQFARRFFTSSYHGHYAPLAFWLEFEQTKLVGTRASYWKWRAIAALALVLSALFILARTVGAALNLAPVANTLISAALVAFIAFQPLMTEFIAWPFLIFQMGWMFLSAIALTALINATNEARSVNAFRWIWLAAAAAYGSMHFTGLGLITAVATSAVLAQFLCFANPQSSSRSQRKHLAAALICLGVLTTAHVFCMAYLPPPNPVAPHSVSSAPDLRSLMAFTAIYPFFICLSFLIGTPQRYDAALLQNAWPFAFALLALIAGSVVHLIRKVRQTAHRNSAVRLVLLTFSGVAYVTFTGLLAFREIREPSMLPFSGMFAGARYIVPATTLFFSVLLLLIMPLALRRPVFVSSMSGLLAICALISQRQFARSILPKLQPTAQISHARAWSLITAMTKEARTARLPVPDVIMGDLTKEFYSWDLKLFQPVLRHDLHLRPDEQLEFIDIKEALGPRRDQYARAVPSFARLREVMHVEGSARP